MRDIKRACQSVPCRGLQCLRVFLGLDLMGEETWEPPFWGVVSRVTSVTIVSFSRGPFPLHARTAPWFLSSRGRHASRFACLARYSSRGTKSDCQAAVASGCPTRVADALEHSRAPPTSMVTQRAAVQDARVPRPGLVPVCQCRAPVADTVPVPAVHWQYLAAEALCGCESVTESS